MSRDVKFPLYFDFPEDSDKKQHLVRTGQHTGLLVSSTGVRFRTMFWYKPGVANPSAAKFVGYAPGNVSRFVEI